MFARLIATLVLILLGWAVPCAAQSHIEKDGITIEFHADDEEIAQKSLKTLLDARDEFAPRLPAGGDPIRAIISHTFADFKKRLGRFSQVSVAGVAFPAQGLIIVKSPRIISTHNDYNGTLRHELVHILLERNTDTSRVPKWLNEGICMSLANEYHWESMFEVARLYMTGRIQAYEALDKNLLKPGDETKFGDTYAQGLSMTRYLRDTLGEEKFWGVILGMRILSFPDALKKHGGIKFEDFWQGYHNSLWMTTVLGSMGSGVIFAPAAFLVIIAWFRQRGQNKEIERQWEREEDGGEVILTLDDVSEGLHEWELEDEEEESW